MTTDQQRSPSQVQVQLQEALRAHQQGAVQEAYRRYGEIIRIDPGHAEAWHLLGVAAHQCGEHRQAEEAIRRAIALRPAQASFHSNLAAALRALGNAPAAAEACREAIQIDANLADAHYNLGNALRDLGQPGEAVESYRRALALRPGWAAAETNLGVALADCGRFDEAGDCYRRVLARHAAFAPARYNRGLLRLLQGDFEAGWPDYGWRFAVEGVDITDHPVPLWDGRPLESASILVQAEQGVGDEILFSTCLPDLLERTNRVLVECDERLLPLFRRTYPQAEFVVRPASRAEAHSRGRSADMRIPAGSLLPLFRPTVNAFPTRAARLVVDAERCKRWRDLLTRPGAEFLVGISWRGGRDPAVRALRTIPLCRWQQVRSVPGVRFFNLQYDRLPEDEPWMAGDGAAAPITDPPGLAPKQDLDGLAALLAALDLVITVDNATAHLAAAVGTPTWLLLPVHPDWRWQCDRDEALWYPSVRTFRQRQVGDWADVLGRVAAALAEQASGRS